MEFKDNPDARIRVPRFLLSEQNAFYFKKMGETVQFRPEQMLAVPGCYPRYCYFVRSGRVIAGTAGGSSGDKRILLSFEQNTLLLEQYLLTGKRCDLYYKAVEKTTAQMISYHDLTNAMKTDFSVTLDVLNAISDLGPWPISVSLTKALQMPARKYATNFSILFWPLVRRWMGG